jgi:hypothetical protein
MDNILNQEEQLLTFIVNSLSVQFSVAIVQSNLPNIPNI